MSSTDFSMMTETDVANIVLQRSDIVSAGPQIRAWMKGDSAPLLALAAEKRGFLLSAGLEAAEKACATFTDATDALAPGRVADIGCGYAFADLFLYRRYGCDLVLIDIEEGNDRHFGFNAAHPGYTSLERARAFLVANGVPADKITTVNPNQTEVSGLGAFDLVISLLSCGFHYPVETYAALFAEQVSQGGGIVIDIRKGSGGMAELKKFGAVSVLQSQQKHSRVMVRV
ncbi:MAG: hypothetical protein U5K36_03830 [Roseovarius sp.]|nr:hypothetical protein [Roseovarius sp.]